MKRRSARQAGEPSAQPVLGRKLGAVAGEGVLLLGELVAAGRDGVGAAGEFVEFNQPGLVGVEQPGALVVLVLDGDVGSLELSGDELVLVGWRAGDHGAPVGDQLPGVKQRPADLREDVLVELVGANVALRAATHAWSGAQRIMAAIVVVVVVVPGAVTAPTR
jgi:hypothetical protein